MDIPTDEYYRSWVKRTISGEYRARGNVADAQCIIAPAFGIRTDDGNTKPGLSNEDLASYIRTWAAGLPLITQPELAMALPEVTPVSTIRAARQEGRRLDTTEFLEQCSALMHDNGWAVALLVAHPNHVTWVDYICTHLDIPVVVPPGLEGVRFDPHSDQYWTRSLNAWQSEVRARQHAGDARTVSDESQ